MYYIFKYYQSIKMWVDSNIILRCNWNVNISSYFQDYHKKKTKKKICLKNLRNL